MNKKIKEKTEASDKPLPEKENKSNIPIIVEIPVNKIKHCRWGIGIRDQETYKMLKEDIKRNGMRNPIHVRPVENGFYEVYDGDHRLRNAKEEKWEKIQCIIDKDIPDKEAREICASTMITTSGLNPVQLENLIYEMWNSNQYKGKSNLASKLSLSGQWVGQLIRAKELRDKSKLSFDPSVSTHFILDVESLRNDDDKIALLKMVKERKIKPGDMKDYANKLSKVSEETRKKVLYDGVPLSSINSGTMSVPKSEKMISSKTPVRNPNFLVELYNSMRTLPDQLAFITDDDEKRKAINYIKFCAGLCLKTLYIQEKIGKDFFESVVRHELDIDKDMLHHFDGLSTKGVSFWLEGTKSEDEDS